LRASLDTNVIIHFYKDGLQEIWNVLRIVRWMCCDRGSMMKERAR